MNNAHPEKTLKEILSALAETGEQVTLRMANYKNFLDPALRWEAIGNDKFRGGGDTPEAALVAAAESFRKGGLDFIGEEEKRISTAREAIRAICMAVGIEAGGDLRDSDECAEDMLDEIERLRRNLAELRSHLVDVRSSRDARIEAYNRLSDENLQLAETLRKVREAIG